VVEAHRLGTTPRLASAPHQFRLRFAYNGFDVAADLNEGCRAARRRPAR
jgi:hypothetical protein